MLSVLKPNPDIGGLKTVLQGVDDLRAESKSIVPKSVSKSALDDGLNVRPLVNTPSRVCRWAPVATSQSRTVPSCDADADASTWPSGEKATELTAPLWPSSVCFWAPVATSQSRTVLSLDPDASVWPSGEKATELTQPSWPSSVCWCESQ